jgi:hypothetical protein
MLGTEIPEKTPQVVAGDAFSTYFTCGFAWSECNGKEEGGGEYNALTQNSSSKKDGFLLYCSYPHFPPRTALFYSRCLGLGRFGMWVPAPATVYI